MYPVAYSILKYSIVTPLVLTLQTLQAVTPGGLLDTCPHFTNWHLVASMATSWKSYSSGLCYMLLLHAPAKIHSAGTASKKMSLFAQVNVSRMNPFASFHSDGSCFTLSQTRSLTQAGDKIYSVNDFTDAQPALMGRTM